MKRFSFSIFLGLLLCIAPSLQAQVTIGMGKEPNAGSLLDLKSQDADANNVNATKGLGMPRVNLINLTPTSDALLAVSMGATGTYGMDTHIGLTVYNTNQCLRNAATMNMGAGLFVWDGSKWQQMNGAAVIFEGLAQASPSETSGADNWGGKVIRHQAKAGVYEEFTSAVFGAAGRWMTTNLSAKAYDGNKHSTDALGTATVGVGSLRTLTGPNGNPLVGGLVVYNSAYWAYPNTGVGAAGPTDATEYNKNKALGYLYTWDAATAGKGGTTGIVGGSEVGDSHAVTNPQGICPSGWHLPSDYEWTLLENAIIQQTSLYSSMADLDPSNPTHLPQYTGTTNAWRGTAGATPYSTAMKEVCETLSSYDPAGKSKTVSQGGFSAPLAGSTNNGSSVNFGASSYFWSSSSVSPSNAWSRYLYYDEGRVYEYSAGRYGLFSVRCKKD